MLSLVLASPVPPVDAPSLPVVLRCEDGSTLNVELLDSELELFTKYGTLKIAATDVRQIQFATRTPPEIASKIEAAIEQLNHPDYEVREAATKELKGYRGRAFFPCLRASKRTDPELSRRADDVCRAVCRPDLSENDVVHTADSKFTGKLTAESLRVRTAQFGEQRVKLADVISLSTSGPSLEPAPLNMVGKEIGKEYTFAVTGAAPGAMGTGLWGSGPYTLDSSLGAAAVHSGLVQPGKQIVVTIRVIASPPAFTGSTANGFTSHSYAEYPAGAFEFVR